MSAHDLDDWHAMNGYGMASDRCQAVNRDPLVAVSQNIAMHIHAVSA